MIQYRLYCLSLLVLGQLVPRAAILVPMYAPIPTSLCTFYDQRAKNQSDVNQKSSTENCMNCAKILLNKKFKYITKIYKMFSAAETHFLRVFYVRTLKALSGLTHEH